MQKNEFVDILADRLVLSQLTEVMAQADSSANPSKSYALLTQALPVCLDAGAGSKITEVSRDLIDNPAGELAFAISEQDTQAINGYLVQRGYVSVDMDI